MAAIRKTIIVSTLIFGECLTLHAQLLPPGYEIGLHIGAFVYQGDLTPQRMGSYKTMKPVANVFVNHIISPLLSLRTGISLGGLRGDDGLYAVPAYRKQRNFNFRSPVVEVSGMAVADLLRNNMTNQRFRVSPFVFGGLGVSFLKIRRDWSGFNGEYFSGEPSTIAGLQADIRHPLPRVIPVIPLGAGIRYGLSSRVSVSVETSYRITFSDYLDGFSKAANTGRKDSYLSHTIGIVYRMVPDNLRNPLKCPVFK